MSKIIEADSLNFGYSERLVLKSISFSVDKGDFLGIIGASVNKDI